MGLRRLSALALLAAGCADAPSVGSIAEALRPDTRDGGVAPPAYEPGSNVEHLDSTSFRIHFVRSGVHAVAAADLDLDGTPDSVQTVSSEYERVLAYLRDTLGFRPPRSDAELPDENGGDGRFDVYLLNFPNSADGSFRAEGCSDGSCSGYMLQENDFDGRGYPDLRTATRILASHELFHAVQNAYRSVPSTVLSEATAVWASEIYDPTLPDFEGFLPAFMMRPERSLLQEPLGPPDSFSYAAGVLFVMIGERCQPTVVRALWEELASRDQAWPDALDRVLQRDCGRSLAEIFLEFARWNLQTGARAGDEGYTLAARYPQVAEQAITLPHEDPLLRTLPLSTHYFVAEASEPVALWASRGELSWLFAIEGADGRLRELGSAPASQVSMLTPAAGERVHAALVDTRKAGATLRVGLCLGASEQVNACKDRMGGALPSDDAGLPEAMMFDAGTAPPDAGSRPVIEDAGSGADASIDAARTSDDGCSLSGSHGGLGWLSLALLRRRRRYV